MTSKSNTESPANGKTSREFGAVDDVRQNLGTKSILGSSSLLLSEIGCNVFRLLGTVIMARLLTPEHFGLIGMVTALTAFGEMFKDLGLGTATIQRKEITHEQISTLFWINTGVGVAIMLVLVGAAPLISRFYDDARLLWISIAISSTFIFGGLTVQHQALLRREMCFAKLAFIQVLSTASSTVIGILLAWQGFEYWALVWKEISRTVIQAGATWLLSHWLPGFPRRGTGVREMFKVGSHVTGFNILAFGSASLDTVLLGKFWGAASVGLYKQASLLLLLPTSLFSYPITYVMTPALSALQSEPKRYSSYYEKVLSFLAFGYMPVIAYLGVYANSVITIVLGQKWLAASDVLQILAIGACVQGMTSTFGIVMITSGRTKAYLKLGVYQSLLLALAFVIGVNWGLLGIAWASVIFAYATLLPLAWFSFRKTPISLALFFRAVSLPALSSIITALILMMVHPVLQSNNAFMDIGWSLLVAPLIYCGTWMALPGGKQKLMQHMSYIWRAIETVCNVLIPGMPTSTAPALQKHS